jgi:hypothetical protein
MTHKKHIITECIAGRRENYHASKVPRRLALLDRAIKADSLEKLQEKVTIEQQRQAEAERIRAEREKLRQAREKPLEPKEKLKLVEGYLATLKEILADLEKTYGEQSGQHGYHAINGEIEDTVRLIEELRLDLARESRPF